MKIVDLAASLVPGAAHEIVGIRPGEKLHEVMITEDDARMTLELDDRYAICPGIADWRDDHLRKLGARPVEDGFRYSSDGNKEWLDAKSLADIINRKAA